MDDATPYEKMPEFDLDDARFDQPSPASREDIRSFVICTTPRSGSWLLCRQLVNAGIGVPSEYFNFLHATPLCARWQVDPRDTRAYLNRLRARRTTRNGAFGTKLLWTQYVGRRSAIKVELLGRSVLVFLHREDVAQQAVSLHLSHRTGIWDFDGRVSTPPRSDIPWGDPAHLDSCDRSIRLHNQYWRELFSSRRIDPIAVRYEDFVADQRGTIVQIADALGLGAGDYRVPPAEPRDSAFPAEIEAQRRELVQRWRAMVESRRAGTARAAPG
ncbi:MAG: Stf0 family sulfotransferase [Betaproteobacteria bacterium]